MRIYVLKAKGGDELDVPPAWRLNTVVVSPQSPNDVLISFITDEQHVPLPRVKP